MITTKKVHRTSGLILTIFVGLHLFNHLCAVFGADTHIAVMNDLRVIYRNAIVETFLLITVFAQIVSGLTLYKANRKTAVTAFEKLHVWTGLYLAAFLLIHVGAVLVGRYFLHLDTNFYFGVAGINSFPANLFFIPYYGFAIFSFTGHIASIHSKKMKRKIFSLTPNRQATIILIFGILLTLAIFYGLTNHFTEVAIPKEYNILIGK